MCEQCDPALARLHDDIREIGFAVMLAGRSMTARGWAYTLGLVDGFDHPELVIAGLPLEDALDPLSALARCVVAGDRIDTPFQHGLDGIPIGTVPVHERHFERGLMSWWDWYYQSLGRFDIALRALQIVLPAGGYCFHHQSEQPDLGSPRHVPFDGLSTQVRRGCPGGDGVGRPGARSRSSSRASRPKVTRRTAPPATMSDLYWHRRSARRRR